MKKKILFIGMILFAMTTQAQEIPQGFSVGLQLGAEWAHNVSPAHDASDVYNKYNIHPYRDTLGFIVSPGMTFRTRMFECGVSYNVINFTGRIYTALCIPDAFDIYVSYQQSSQVTCPQGMYGSAGIKKTFFPTGWLELTPYAELGNDLICTSFVRFGFVAQPQFFFTRGGGSSGRVHTSKCPEWGF